MLDNINEFFAMGGYGFYVWSSFFFFMATFFGLWIVPFWQLRKKRSAS